MTSLPVDPSRVPAPRPTAPLIVACLRFIDLRPDVDPLTGAVRRDVKGAGFSAADLAAVEYALRIAEAWSGTVLAICAAPAAAEPALRDIGALGVDVRRLDRTGGSGRHTGGGHHGEVDVEPLGSAPDYLTDVAGDEQALAADLAAAIRSVGRPALVLCGDHSFDRGTGAVPALLAHELGAAQALGLVELQVDGDRGVDGGDPGLVGLRRLDAGRRERLRLPRPTVCSVEAAGVRLRRASLPALLAANRAEVPVLTLDTLPPAGPPAVRAVRIGTARPFRPRPRVVEPPTGNPRERLLELTGAMVAHDPPTVVGPVGAAEAADALLAYLTRNGYLPDPTTDVTRSASAITDLKS